MARRSGLGKGLGALIPGGVEGSEVTVDLRDESPFREVPITSIKVNALQPRKHLDKTALQPLADSMRELGVLQPLLVRSTSANRYELIAGERRWRAAQLAGLQTVPVIVREAENVHSLEQALVENLHRKDLNAIDEAAAYQQLLTDFEMTHDEVGRRVGKSRSAITNVIRLLQLPPKVQKHLVEERLAEGHGRALLGTDDEAFQIQLADRAAKEGMSVRAVEEAVRLRNELDKPQTKRRKPLGRSSNPAALEWQDRLGSYLDTRVVVTSGGKRGRIVIDFADLDDLERVAQLIEAQQP